MSERTAKCEACGKRGQWASVAVGNDRWWLCYDHFQQYRVMVLAWFAARQAH
jgi:hypothetical protein